MFRKITLALATSAALGAAALAPTSASAWGPPPLKIGGGGPHGGHHFGGRWGLGAGIAAGVVGGAILATSCYRKMVIDTPLGPRVRWVNVCY